MKKYGPIPPFSRPNQRFYRPSRLKYRPNPGIYGPNKVKLQSVGVIFPH
ncbi:hypothetical protein NX023_12665 [Cytobacillus firmus]|nr:hypothetical protein [Cytobacillus firmus]